MTVTPAAPPTEPTETASGPLDPPADELHWIEAARALAPDFQARAPELEESATLPVDNLRAIHASGLDTAFLPAEHGGEGASMRTFGRVVGVLAGACPSTACIWLMHMGAAIGLVQMAPPPAAEQFAAALRDGKRFANALSEPTSGNLFLNPLQNAEPTDGGWTLEGAKRFVSGSEIADHLLVNALVDGAPTFFGIDPDDTVTAVDIWDTMGLRATRSQLLTFAGTLLPEPRRCRPPQGDDANPIAVGLPWLSIGLAEAALGDLRDHANGRVLPSTGAPLSHMQWVQFAVADAWIALRGARLLAETASWYADHDPARFMPASFEAKLAANEAARQVADVAMRAGGASGYLKSSPIERHFRNAQAGGLMAYSVEVCRDVIGKSVLGVDGPGGADGEGTDGERVGESAGRR
ncbi:MAG TPA: acyl-CoA dehydrogenase family protein [Acidimicrobiales bacterium]